MSTKGTQVVRARERVPTGRRGRPSKSMIAAAMERPFCSYLHRFCFNNRLEGHKYCTDHIMMDKTAPFRQCTFIHPTTGRRCPRAAHKVDRRAAPLCQYHKLIRLNLPPQINPEDNQKESLSDDLAHHRRRLPDVQRPESKNTYWILNGDGTAAPSTKLKNTIKNFNTTRLREDLEPLELFTAEEIATRHNNADSDTESVDNSCDIFRNASVYTEEEIHRTLRDKIIRLRRLYIEQFSHLQYMLKEKRLKFIQAQRAEDELFGETFSFRNYSDSVDYPKLRAMLNYHKTFGPEALVQDQAKQIKQNRPPTVGPHHHPRADSTNEPPTETNVQSITNPNTSICIFSKTPQGCNKPTIPLSPYCKQHILYDSKQVLFRPCAGGMPPCLTPVVSNVRKNKCWLHTEIN